MTLEERIKIQEEATEEASKALAVTVVIEWPSREVLQTAQWHLYRGMVYSLAAYKDGALWTYIIVLWDKRGDKWFRPHSLHRITGPRAYACEEDAQFACIQRVNHFLACDGPALVF